MYHSLREYKVLSYGQCLATILDKTDEKITFLGNIFSKFRSRPILPSPLPLEVLLLGLQKKDGSLSICSKQLWTGGGGTVFFTQSRWFGNSFVSLGSAH